MSDQKTIQEQCDAINYNPSPAFWDKDEKTQISMIRSKALEYARRDALKVVGAYFVGENLEALPADIQEAVVLLTVKRVGGGGGGGGSKNVFMDTLKKALMAPGDYIDELEMFKALKLGRGEIRAKIRENLKSADADKRMWIELDAENECWELLAIGEEQPEGWLGAPIDAE